MRSINLGILAHVDAGKTSLTERLLYAAGVIDRLGSVDAGDTTTDTLALERQRGITIKSAVASFTVGDAATGTTVTIVDTPGHPDFIAEVDRALGVLDGAVLVVSAVEGVQPQTRVLMRALRRLRVPTLLFVNKIDRRGARDLLPDLAAKLSPAVVPMGAVVAPGTPGAAFVPGDDPRRIDVLADLDDAVLRAYVRGEPIDVRARLAAQTRAGRAFPVFAGSAVTGAGVPELMAALPELLPAAAADAGAPPAGTVFKVERGAAGERIAYARLFAGTLRPRDRVTVGGREAKVTGIDVVDAGPPGELTAGRIGRVRGLGAVRIGDALGAGPAPAAGAFAPPTLETVVEPVSGRDRGALYAALTELAEQDPLIDLRRDDRRREISVSLYGEVQKEVIEATLAADYGLAVRFRETTTLHIERPAGAGEAVEVGIKDVTPFLATLGLRVEPAAPGTGVGYRLGVELGSMPYAFFAAVEDTVRATLAEGLHGWPVTDCLVTLTRNGYWPRQSHAHATFDKSMSTTGGDFRGLTPLVLMAALRAAGTTVLEPVLRFRLDAPATAPVLPLLARLGAVPLTATGEVVEGYVPAARVHELERALPGLTGGEGVLEAAFDHWEPVRGPAPARPRTDDDPLHRKEYLLRVQRRV
ncbi:elongation factor G [Spirilliplanes yamanashiensis]|uniref:Tetracycline resistance protein, tetM/tetO subfamily n=1 Tax=Spirilliplanes yamanashiensis TaxID=42233 RepID=A0A8J3Y4D4_9ACTN|nr:TetM/TetW/TetO/TetS family tetracycline resistance ribosomal protection protein [Spirilliplanes yamanashiensis]MDP9819987.1 ribosomal protection tetracycline resistance protein [Spirilliplanes yamanashiensis]GIJ01194.1 tetracycline resistance protein, tetM/tetO subfamily [Spirilliplanes yamanashiensis]